MTSILIKKITCNDSVCDVLIEGNRFSRIAPKIEVEGARVIDGENKIIIPPFYNGHTHAAMTLLRGYADDMPLQQWLTEYIWPFEAKMTPADIYAGSRLAILEMIKSGTVFFCDMYWHPEETIRAVEEMGVRATIGLTYLDFNGDEQISNRLQYLEHPYQSSRIQYAVSPHALSTVSEKWLHYGFDLAKEHDCIYHIHLSETQGEVEDCLSKYGLRPVQWMEKAGLLAPNVVGAHGVYLDDEELDILKACKASLIHNPCANMKLASGVFRSKDVLSKQLNLGMGTDGCSSNNNLDMREEMKMAALLAKVRYGAEVFSAEEVFKCATVNTARIYGINAGEIAEGKLADALIVDLNNERLVPNHHFLSNWVYAADSSCIDTVICDGRLLMENGHVDGEEEIVAEAKKAIR